MSHLLFVKDGFTKGLNAVHENPTVFSENSGADALGVGTNMAKSIRYWRVLLSSLRNTSVKVSL